MVSGLKSKHPEWTASSPDWTLMRDAYKGERHVKSKGPVYLPHTSSHIMDGVEMGMNTVGFKAYESYKKRARFPNYTREAIQMAIGMMHSQPPEIKLPKAMEGIRSTKGETLPVLLRRINAEQLLTGRIGLMADIPTNPSPGEDFPYLATYITERIINWDDGTMAGLIPQKLNLVVIDETEHVRNSDFSWEIRDKFRVLALGSFGANESQGVYRQGVFEDDDFQVESMIVPSWRGRTLDKIPFVFINPCDVTADVDDPPLLDLGNMCMTIYRSDADYRQNLFMQGQDTFVTIGGQFQEDDVVRVGAGSRIDLPTGGDAKYVGVQSSGLSEQREALHSLQGQAGSMGAQTLDTTSRERESGDSLRIRVAARTADMNQIADTGAAGLEFILKTCAEWMGENPEEVSVLPNKEFGEMPLTGQTMVEIATARNLGWPISAKSMHDLSRKRRMTTKTFEEEVAEAEKEAEDDDFVFAKTETGDRTSLQPNAENMKGQDTNPKGNKK